MTKLKYRLNFLTITRQASSITKPKTLKIARLRIIKGIATTFNTKQLNLSNKATVLKKTPTTLTDKRINYERKPNRMIRLIIKTENCRKYSYLN